MPYTVQMTGTEEISPEILAMLGASFGAQARQNLADQITRRQLAADGNQTNFSFAKVLELPDDVPTLLDEYEDPASVPLAGASTTMTAEEHGLVVTRTSLADAISGGALTREAAAVVGRSAARFLDRRLVGALAAGTNVMDAGGVLTPQLINRAYNELTKAGATKDAQGFYRAILHPDQILDLKNAIGEGSFTDTMKYADPASLIRGEVGAIGGFRIIENAGFAPAAGPGAGLYRAVFMGADALGQGVSVGPEMRMTSSDKLARFLNVGWYYVGVMGIIAQEQVFTVRTTSSLDQ